MSQSEHDYASKLKFFVWCRFLWKHFNIFTDTIIFFVSCSFTDDKILRSFKPGSMVVPSTFSLMIGIVKAVKSLFCNCFLMKYTTWTEVSFSQAVELTDRKPVVNYWMEVKNVWQGNGNQETTRWNNTTFHLIRFFKSMICKNG